MVALLAVRLQPAIRRAISHTRLSAYQHYPLSIVQQCKPVFGVQAVARFDFEERQRVLLSLGLKSDKLKLLP